jgi:IS4 transposase
MLLDAALERFAQSSPVTVLLRASLEYALPAAEVDALFVREAQSQYTRELLFSSVVEVMSLVVLRIRPSVHNAYQACRDKLGVSAKALYDKLAHTEPEVCSALVHYQAGKLQPLLQQFGGRRPEPLPGYRVRLLDGNHLAKTDRRLKELRGLRPGPLPGQALVVYDPRQALVTDVRCCEDGHAQERALLGQILPLVQARDVWVADRNFCTTDFLFGIAARGGFFVIRQHRQNLRWRLLGRRRGRGRTETGRVYEQQLALSGPQGQTWVVRRITVCLDQPTREGETEIHLISNLPAAVAAKDIARLYRGRWTIETAFAQIEDWLDAEIATLAYPRAALLAFSVGLLAYNLLCVIQAALRGVHGGDKVEQEVSAYALAEEATMTYRGMMIAVGGEPWKVFEAMGVAELAAVLTDLASRVRLEAFRKHPRGPKKTVQKRGPRKPHVATARLLKERKSVLK